MEIFHRIQVSRTRLVNQLARLTSLNLRAALTHSVGATDMFEMDENVLNTALLILEAREPQKAALFDDDETPGVKFF
jgi:hypothetical protein